MSHWITWANEAEGLIGHTLDGDQNEDGFSLDDAYLCWLKCMPVADYVEIVKKAKEARYVGYEEA